LFCWGVSQSEVDNKNKTDGNVPPIHHHGK
jgi:hypothetical protein